MPGETLITDDLHSSNRTLTNELTQTILISVDALRPDHLNQYGYERNTSPGIDILSDEGKVYKNAYANGSNSGEAIPSLLASRYKADSALSTGPTISSILPDDVVTAGYHSNPLLARLSEKVVGFDIYEDYAIGTVDREDPTDSHWRRMYRSLIDNIKPLVGNNQLTRSIRNFIFPEKIAHKFTPYISAKRITDDIIEFLDINKAEDFFLWVHYMDPHRPYGIDLQNPRFTDPIEHNEIKELMSKAGIKPDAVTEKDINKMIDLYDSDIYYLSENLNRLFNHLHKIDIWENVNIILTADHGEEFGEHSLFFHRNRPYNELINIPFIFKSADGDYPNEDRLIEAVDIAPTVSEFYGIEPPDNFVGRAITDSMKKPAISTGSFSDDATVIAVTDESFKYIWAEDTEELYDIKSDPSQQIDISEDNEGICDNYRSKIPPSLTFMDNHTVEDVENDEMEERLSALGYLE